MNFEIKDLTWMGAFGIKLLEVISSWCWTVYDDVMKPKRLREEWKIIAKNKKELIKAKAEWEVNALIIKYKWVEQIKTFERLKHKETKRQINIDKVIKWTIDNVDLNENTSNEKVDEDWITKFFNVVWDVSSEKMQLIWSKILAWEIQKPWKFSLRTLDILKNIDKKEADSFMKISTLVVNDTDIFKLWWKDEIFNWFGINYNDILLSQEAWLLLPTNTLNFTLNSEGWWGEQKFYFKNKIIHVKLNKSMYAFQIFWLTKAWTDLMKIISPDVNEEYFEKVKTFLLKSWLTIIK